MDSDNLERLLKDHADFIRWCNFEETDQFPSYSVELEWCDRLVKPFWKNLKIAQFTLVPNLSMGTSKTGNETASSLDVAWSLDLELLPVVDDGTMSFQYAIPFNRANSVAAQSAVRFHQPAPPSPGPSRIRDQFQAVSRRIRGIRQAETRRSLVDTLSRDPNNPQCVLLAAVKWDGLAKDSFTITEASVSVGNYEIKSQDPFAMHLTSDNSFVVDSATSFRYRQGYEAFAQGMPHGISSLQTWLNSYAAFPARGDNSTDLTTVKVCMTIQMNEASIPRIGFPFREISSAKGDDFQATLRESQLQKTSGVRLQISENVSFYMPAEVLTNQSGYFRLFLSETWSGQHGQNNHPLVIFPQVPPFTTSPDVVEQVVYYFLQRKIFPGLKENWMELMVAADVLEFPQLMKLAQVAAVNCIGMENVTKVIRFAWEFRADLLFRAALLYLKANYDEIWVNNKQDLEELGLLLSDPNFLQAFRMQRKCLGL